MADGDSYTTLEPAAGGGPGRDLVLYRAENGRREILVPAAKLKGVARSCGTTLTNGAPA